MIEPQGPLPSEVYWRRRLLAIVGGAVAVVAVIALIVLASSGGSGDSDPANAASKSSATPSAPAGPSTTPEAPKSSEAPSGGGNHGAGGDPSASPTPTAPAPDGRPAPGAAPAAGDGNTCADQGLSVVLYTDKPTYSAGDQPVFTIVVTNGGLAPCSRDVGKASQNVVVRSLDGDRTLWSAQDCAPDKTVNNQVLAPGQQVNDTITWSGTTSSPGCKRPRVQIPVGGYQAIAKIGEKESAPITFNVVAPAQQ